MVAGMVSVETAMDVVTMDETEVKPWYILMDEPATAEVWHFGKKEITRYETLGEAIYDYYDSLVHESAHICNVTASDGTVWRKE